MWLLALNLGSLGEHLSGLLLFLSTFFLLSVLFFGDRLSLCCSGWPGTCYGGKDDPELIDPLASNFSGAGIMGVGRRTISPALGNVRLELENRALCMPDKPSSN